MLGVLFVFKFCKQFKITGKPKARIVHSALVIKMENTLIILKLSRHRGTKDKREQKQEGIKW